MNIVWTWDIVRRVIEVLWLINIAFAVWTVFRTRRDIASTWAWLLVLSVFPVIGFIAYLFVGRKISNEDIFSIRSEQESFRERLIARQEALLEKHQLLLQSGRLARARQLVSLSSSLDDAIVTFNNRVRVFIDGQKLFSEMIRDLTTLRTTFMLNFILSTRMNLVTGS